MTPLIGAPYGTRHARIFEFLRQASQADRTAHRLLDANAARLDDRQALKIRAVALASWRGAPSPDLI